MTELWTPTVKWSEPTQRRYTLGVDRGMLYVVGVGVSWSGLVSVNRTNESNEKRVRYLDGVIYRSDQSAQNYSASVTAFTYPDEFDRCLGNVKVDGLTVHGQFGKTFGFCYRSRSGDAEEFLGEYTLHFVYECTAQESDYEHSTMTDASEATPFSFDITAGSVVVSGFRPTSYFSVDSRTLSAAKLASLEQLLYGKDGSPASLPPIATIRALTAG